VLIARWDRRILIGEVDARLHGWDPGSKNNALLRTPPRDGVLAFHFRLLGLKNEEAYRFLSTKV
jgi:hypothetical protein